MNRFNHHKVMYSIIIFFSCQVLSLMIIFYPDRYPSLQWVFIGALIVLACSIISDFCAFAIIRKLERQLDEEVQIKKMIKLNTYNDDFFDFAAMQQRNIRFFYHDLSNHIITLDILKKQGKTAEIAAYNQKLKERYENVLPMIKTGNYFLDIIGQYCYEEHKCLLRFEGAVKNEQYKQLLWFIQKIMPYCENNEVQVIIKDDGEVTFIMPIVNETIKQDALMCGYEVHQA
ncbi:MAG: hypothetical protein MR210_07520 [Erysipelotrichaceae bacterium]|nr:hypothetical protein [Erysipelotrichaceae bacterium]MDY5251504.1 hypothetical protein [Erysipelotrichaceae bacterium]